MFYKASVYYNFFPSIVSFAYQIGFLLFLILLLILSICGANGTNGIWITEYHKNLSGLLRKTNDDIVNETNEPYEL